MRILYANDCTSLYDQLFIKFLIEKGHDVHLVTFTSSKQNLAETLHEVPYFSRSNIHHFDTGFVPIAQLKMWVAHGINTCILTRLLRKIRPDVLNGHFITNYGFWSALSLYHPFLLTIWGTDVLVLPSQLKTGKHIARFVLKRADAVIVDSMVQKQATVVLGCDPRKIVFFPWAVDLKRFSPHVSGERIRKSLRWEENSIIFCTRWHKPVYGVKYLLYAVPEIIREYPNARFMIGGYGPLSDKFKSFVARERLGQYVKFVGKISHEEMPEYMAACDIYVSPSLSDGTSASLLEAMACSKPVVVSDIAGNLEWVTNYANGLTVPTRDAKALTSALSWLLQDEGLRKKFGTKNWKIVSERADLRRGLLLYEDTLVTLASRRR